ncbi:MAG: imidazole glycerol phosphate synthase subunit HisH [Cytophagales bacterium]|nr:imidazole glycerol phosphate synthase subunit HisH [Cytophagales bacterium]
MDVALIKYNAGNIQSVIFALNRLGIEPIYTDDADIIKNADKVIFPGVGEAYACMQSLKDKQLDKIIPHLKQPVLGICVGLQLMCNHSEERDTQGMGIFDIDVKKFAPDNTQIKIPQMGWNTVYDLKSTLFKDIPLHSYVYYVHSYYAALSAKYTIATTKYVLPYSAALCKDNFYAVQFHAEKSSDTGSKILDNFIKYC